jgi:hypothetical protein
MFFRVTFHPSPARGYRTIAGLPAARLAIERKARTGVAAETPPTPNRLFFEITVTLAGALAFALVVASFASAYVP